MLITELSKATPRRAFPFTTLPSPCCRASNRQPPTASSLSKCSTRFYIIFPQPLQLPPDVGSRPPVVSCFSRALDCQVPRPQSDLLMCLPLLLQACCW